jgi:hypothetical protein
MCKRASRERLLGIAFMKHACDPSLKSWERLLGKSPVGVAEIVRSMLLRSSSYLSSGQNSYPLEYSLPCLRPSLDPGHLAPPLSSPAVAGVELGEGPILVQQ